MLYIYYFAYICIVIKSLTIKKNKTMNKTELISAMAEKAGLTKVDAHKALDAFIEATVENMKKGEKVTIPGFGTFSVTERAARTGINPQSKKKIKIAAKKAGKFKMSKSIVF